MRVQPSQPKQDKGNNQEGQPVFQQQLKLVNTDIQRLFLFMWQWFLRFCFLFKHTQAYTEVSGVPTLLSGVLSRGLL